MRSLSCFMGIGQAYGLVTFNCGVPSSEFFGVEVYRFLVDLSYHHLTLRFACAGRSIYRAWRKCLVVDEALLLSKMMILTKEEVCDI